MSVVELNTKSRTTKLVSELKEEIDKIQARVVSMGETRRHMRVFNRLQQAKFYLDQVEENA